MEGREREGPQVTVEPGPLRDLLRHWTLIMQIVAAVSLSVSISSSTIDEYV